MNRLKYICIVLLLGIGLKTEAQDPQFSQFYAAPTYLNPAFAGTSVQSRVIMNYRHQWPSIPGAFVTYNFSYDINVESINSGLGFLMTHDKAGSGGLRFTTIAGQYVYQLKLNQKWFLRPAVQYGFSWRDVDWMNLTFGDQLIRGGDVTSSEFITGDKVKYFDFSSGMLLFSKKSWLGVSAHHINEPNESLKGDESPLPIKYSVHGGYVFKIHTIGDKNVDAKIKAAFNFKSQNKFDQLDLGVYYEHNPIVIGVWYRGIPLFKQYDDGYQNNDAVIALFGYNVKNLRIGYTYDMTISRLFSNTGGTHEISLTYEFASKEVSLSRRRRVVDCPKF
jgi:type IX secretion system PorP/SprF family membrane protein